MPAPPSSWSGPFPTASRSSAPPWPGATPGWPSTPTRRSWSGTGRTRPSAPDGAGQGANAPAAGPLLAGWAQGGAQGRSVGAAEGQGGGQAFGSGHGGGQDWLGGTGSAVVEAGAGPAEAQGGGQDGP